MKKIYNIFTVILVLLASAQVAYAQKAFYFGPDATVNENDSVVIRLNEYEGTIQWQKSLDLDVWENIPGAVHDTLLFVSDTTTYFRAQVIAGECDPFYSDTTMVGVHKLNEDVKLIDEDHTVLISDSTELANGIYRFSSEPAGVEIGSVILGQQGEGFMRRVTAIQQEQEEFVLETTQANMEDVFDDFALQDSVVITLNESKTIMHGGRPLPLEVLYLPDGASLKKDGSGIDFSNDTIYHDGIISVIMDAGTINFEPTVYREFDYKRILGIPTKLRSMKLTAGGMMEATMGVKVVSMQQISYEYSILIGQFGVVVPAGPVPITIVLSFYLGFDANMQLQMYATAGFESSYQVAFGAEYHRDEEPQWQEVWEEESNFEYTPPTFSVEGLVEAKAYVKPELAIAITGLAGPTFAVDPYLRFKGELDFPEWYWEIAAGIGGYLGFQVGLFGYYILDYNIDLFNYDYILANGSSNLEDVPVLTTLIVTSITSTTAQSGGNVTDDGGAAVTARGVVWSTTPSPTIENNQGYTTDGSGLGEFTSTLTGLIPETTYYVRAYATNSAGTGYGQQEEFTTLADTPDTYILTLQISPEGSGQVIGAGEYAEAATVTITATPNANYQFVNWTGDIDHVADASAASTTLTMPAQNITLTANFEFSGGNGEPGDGVTDIDGNFYPSVIIGNQEWMAENLRVTRDANGNNLTRYCYSNDATNCVLYGGLYTWHTVMNGATSSNTNPSNVQGICPTGWHLPSHDEWTQLELYICNQLGNENCITHFPYDNTTQGWQGTNEGNALKSCRQVSSPLGGDCATSEHPRWDLDDNNFGTDYFGFNTLPSGQRDVSSIFFYKGQHVFIWSSTSYSSGRSWYRNIYNGRGTITRSDGDKNDAFSLRCVKDN